MFLKQNKKNEKKHQKIAKISTKKFSHNTNTRLRQERVFGKHTHAHKTTDMLSVGKNIDTIDILKKIDDPFIKVVT